jgi:hypothetical protein
MGMTQAEFDQALRLMGVPGVLRRGPHGEPSVEYFCIIGISSAAAAAPIINSLPENTRVLLMSASILGSFEPCKFDTVEIDNAHMVIEHVVPVRGSMSAKVIGFRCYARGLS